MLEHLEIKYKYGQSVEIINKDLVKFYDKRVYGLILDFEKNLSICKEVPAFILYKTRDNIADKIHWLKEEDIKIPEKPFF